MKNRKLIFLDINNVVYTDDKINNEAMKALEFLIKETKASIVITSSWRRFMSLKEIKNKFPKSLRKSILDNTPMIDLHIRQEYYHYPYEKKDYYTPTRKSQRGLEIRLWLQSNKDKLGCKISKFKSYVILDDSNHGIMLNQQSFYYRINKETGLTLIDVNDLIRILNN